jgi:drug/metabolite transporter (DMT)-like permease
MIPPFANWLALDYCYNTNMPQTLKHSIIIFLAGICYGLMIPLARAAFALGFDASHITATQYLVSSLIMATFVLLVSRRKMSVKTIIKLAGVGVLASGISIFYYRALELLPSATAVTLLFQFVWMGVLVQAFRERKLPKLLTVVSVITIMVGTFFATGLVETGAAAFSLDPLGLFFGILSAVFYTAYLVASAQVATNLPAANRSLVTSIASFLVAILLFPSFFSSDAVLGMGWVGIGFGLATITCVFLIAYSAPHLPGGLVTIMAASELPSGILCAALLVGDAVSALTILGVIVVLIGIVLSESDTVVALLRKRQGSTD